MPSYNHEFPLKDLTKSDCHGILKAAGIRRPEMYELGFPNNNCIGCVRADSMGYWNLIRRTYPEVFQSRARLERLIGHSIIKRKKNGKNMPVFLDELDINAGRNMRIIIPECGAACEIIKHGVE